MPQARTPDLPLVTAIAAFILELALSPLTRL